MKKKNLPTTMKYSVIIPAMNGEKTIDRCIKAILNSKFNEKFELIVVDDASQDNTVNIAKKFGAKVIKNSKCGGPSKARNVGARYAKGKIIVFVDSDVLIFQDTLQKIDRFFNKEKDYVAISCNFDPECEMTDPISRYKHLYMGYILGYNTYLNQPKFISWAFTSTFAIKKDVFECIGGFNEKVRVEEDYLLGWELVAKGYKIALEKQILIKHLHKYTFSCFIKEEFRRSQTLSVIKLTTLFFRKNPLKKRVSEHIVYSILLFPFLTSGLFLSYTNLLFFIIPLIMFYLINFSFLRFCKKKLGIKFMLQAASIIPLDCLIFIVGIVFGILKFLGGERI